ncbi:TIM-barrel domain-containing protein [Hyalangium rubrum]|uniref:Glycoside hydrolase family 31 protein n=1 Tax=Hyalangium rubrum TaxID=3103134 RepID=A0ABU5HB97_9BACT|nr:TIM-barrel domain-containing protein [Hyalangium sp. s54d21]MDY7230536.1 glycoside hydrolase family 31 protein [Hyalangium sp. s54d21]
MRLHESAIEPTRLHLWGTRAALEVRCPMPGVLRLRHAPSSAGVGFLHPQLTPKQSWAVVTDEEQPIQVRREGDTFHVTAEGVALEVARTSGTWSFRDATGRVLARCEAVSGEYAPNMPLNHSRARLALHAPEDEAYLGFGEKVGPLNKRGQRFKFWNTDVMPHHPDTDPLYISIPFSIGLREGIAWGFFMDETWRSEVDVAYTDAERVQWESWGPELDVYLITGPHLADVVRRYVALTGRPPLPPLWSLGAQQSRWGYEHADDIRGVIQAYRSRGLPLDVVYLDIDYLEGYKVWTWDRSRFPDPQGLTREAASAGVRLVPIINPNVKAEPGYAPYEEAKEQDFLVRADSGDVLVGEVWARPAVFPDFTREEVQRWWGDWHKEFLEQGIAGIWNDMNEPACFSLIEATGSVMATGGRSEEAKRTEGKTLPFAARHGRQRHVEVHNVYGMAMTKAGYEGFRKHAPQRRPFLLTRAGYAGMQRYAAAWTGDNSSHWEHLELSMPMLVGLGLSGVAFTGADIPGFIGQPSAELFTRWTQLGTFYPLMRNHAAKPMPMQEPWRFGDRYLQLAKAALERRYRLLPTLYSLMHEASESGLPVLRPLLMVDPTDPEAIHAFDAFLFGRDLLVSPITKPGHTKRMVYLPRGQWLEWPNLDKPRAVREGGQHVIVDGPLDTVPLWLRAGGGVALTRPAAHTTTANWDYLEWHIHAGPDVRLSLYEDAGDGYGESRLTTITGGMDRGRFWLERRVQGNLATPREKETLRIYGLKGVRAITGALELGSLVDGVLEVPMSVKWDRLVVSF